MLAEKANIAILAKDASAAMRHAAPPPLAYYRVLMRACAAACAIRQQSCAVYAAYRRDIMKAKR